MNEETRDGSNEAAAVESPDLLGSFRKVIRYPENPNKLCERPFWGYWPAPCPLEYVTERKRWWIEVRHELFTWVVILSYMFMVIAGTIVLLA